MAVPAISEEATPHPHRFRGQLRPRILLGTLVLLALVICAIFAPVLSSYAPESQDLPNKLKPPAWQAEGNWSHPLGTDNLGRDVLSRILYGSRVSLLVGLFAVTVAGGIGTVLGAVAGYYLGWVDWIVSRMVDVWLAIPFLLLAITVMAFLGQGLANVVIVLVVTRWVQYCRVTRGAVLSLRERDFVTAIRSVGATDSYLILRHIIPNTLPTVLIIATFNMATVILSEASLSFLGVGVPPEVPTWGSMLASGRGYMYRAWWIAFFPGLAIFITVLGINLLGDGLRDYLDPKLRGYQD